MAGRQLAWTCKLKDAAFTYQDMGEILEYAIKAYKSYPARVRIPGAPADLTVEQVRNLAIFDATLLYLNKKGALKEEYVQSNPIQLVQITSESIHNE